jgi:hypothetical protein
MVNMAPYLEDSAGEFNGRDAGTRKPARSDSFGAARTIARRILEQMP